MTNPKRLLLVEDEESHAKLVKRAFEESEWEISHVSSLEGALKWLDENERPSLIIADYRLPDGSGLDLTRGAEKPKDIEVPVIILTAYGTEELAVRSLKFGAMDYVVKSSERFEELPWIAERVRQGWEKTIEQKRAEEDLRESNKRYYELIENVDSIIMRMDPEGKITFFNRFAEELFGYTRDEIVGQNAVGTIISEIESNGKDLREMILDIGRNPERYKKNVNENVTKNGERIWISWTNKPVFDEEGRVVEILCVGNDITEIREAENELKDLAAYLNAVLNSYPDTLLILNEDGLITYINPRFEEDFGYFGEEFIGCGIEEVAEKIVPAEKRLSIIDEIRGGLKSGEKIENVKVEMMNKEEERFFISYSASGILDTSDRLIGEVISIRKFR
ncbi:MAG: Bacterioopsin transcriptional activator [Candidatus Methanolliviera sp. GoM_oil]|nr:MAG: Bacterioopsin transcriptional activator [Candidatus Methanolliviera sp. GoM_oil]